MWYDLGQHDYALYAPALQKHLQMRDDGHKTRVRSRGERFVVQIWEDTP